MTFRVINSKIIRKVKGGIDIIIMERTENKYHNLPCSLLGVQQYNILIKEGIGMDRKREDKPPEEPDEEELLKEYEWAEKHVPDDVIPKPRPGEFEEIWRRIQEERSRP